jgi:hypothetical protein
MARTLPINASEKKKLPQYQALISKGVSPGKANKIIKAFTGKGLRPHIANRYGSNYLREQRAQESQIQSTAKPRLRVADALQRDFISRSNNRFLVDVEFQARDSLTGEMRTVRNTIGLRDGRQLSGIENIIQNRLDQLEAEDRDDYLRSFMSVDRSSVKIVNFFRTQNV